MTLRPLTLAAALAAGTVLAAGTALAQPVPPRPVPSAAPMPTVLSLSAEGRVTHAPDVATFSAGVVSQGKTASEALRANAVDMTRVIAALKRAGVADKDIQTSNLSLSPVYQPQRSLPMARSSRPSRASSAIRRTIRLRCASATSPIWAR